MGVLKSHKGQEVLSEVQSQFHLKSCIKVCSKNSEELHRDGPRAGRDRLGEQVARTEDSSFDTCLTARAWAMS